MGVVWSWMQRNAADMVVLCGAGLLVAGIAFESVPAAFMVAGVMLVAMGILLEGRKPS